MYFSRCALALGLLAAGAQAQSFTEYPTTADLGFGTGPGEDGAVTTEVTSERQIEDDYIMCGLEVEIEIDHDYNGDIRAELTLDSLVMMGMKVIMVIGGTNTCGRSDDIDAIFADGGTGNTCQGSLGPDAGNGRVAPESGSFASFNMYNVQGTWSLRVYDIENTDSDNGILKSWTLRVLSCPENPGGAAQGDPHIMTWDGQWYDFHGQCDLVYLENPEFADNAGLSVHIRTTSRYEYSYIEAAAIRIGEDVLEIGSFGQHFLNGVDGGLDGSQTMGGFAAVTLERNDKKRHTYTIDLGEEQQIIVSTYKDLVSVKTVNPKYVHFKNSVGLLGSFGTGKHLGRNGSIIEDNNEFGKDWQVTENEVMLFQTARHPQFPVQCEMPSPKSQARRLGQTIAEEAANVACEHWGDLKEQCVFDVMATGDLEFAGAW